MIEIITVTKMRDMLILNKDKALKKRGYFISIDKGDHESKYWCCDSTDLQNVQFERFRVEKHAINYFNGK